MPDKRIQGIVASNIKHIMLLGGGTSTAWHIAHTLKKYYAERIELIICDINERQLVHTSILADQYVQVPPIKSPGYYHQMLHYLEKYHVDILIPLIDEDILLFSQDNPDLLALSVYSTAARREIFLALSDKRNLSQTMDLCGVHTPLIYGHDAALCPNKNYFVKNAIGCGSRGAKMMKGKEIIRTENQVIQEVCSGPEITVDVVVDRGTPFTICRERREIKLGVSTKCRVFWDEEIQSIMEKISSKLPLPDVFCVQFMKSEEKKWVLTDFNLRSGGGTAISAAIGFEAVRYAAAGWIGVPQEKNWLQRPSEDRYVVRTYTEIVTK